MRWIAGFVALSFGLAIAVAETFNALLHPDVVTDLIVSFFIGYVFVGAGIFVGMYFAEKYERF